jgi:DNA-binding PadR family transcriptional regulator
MIIEVVPMARKTMETLTEAMFYVLMALRSRPMCGIEIASTIDALTENRVNIGPATLYTVLGRFEKERYIEEIEVSGRKRTYRITQVGLNAYREELERLSRCLLDAQKLERS